MTDLIGSDLGLTEALSKTALVPTTDEAQKAKDYTSDQEVRWCPGCGDYVILNTIRNFLPELGLKRENIAFISGIGCSSRFPYYLETYGFHSIHGRAPTIATGLALARPDLSVWVVTGDGDSLSIGGNHLIHALRRNVNITILLFNNRIYGLTKGQYSPTSEIGKVTKSTPMGSLDQPFNPVSLALGAEATFVGRALDSDRKGLTEVLKAAAAHRGAAIVEILQDCPIFNDGSFDALRKEGAEDRLINLVHGQPIIFGAENEFCVVKSGYGLEIGKTADHDPSDIVVHNAHVDNPAYSFALSRLSEQNLEHTVMGIFRQVNRPVYDDEARGQVNSAMDSKAHDTAALQSLLRGKDTWTVDGECAQRNRIDERRPLGRSGTGRRGVSSYGAGQGGGPVRGSDGGDHVRRARGGDAGAALSDGLRDRGAGPAPARTGCGGAARRDPRGRTTAGDRTRTAGRRRCRVPPGLPVGGGHAEVEHRAGR